MKNFRIFCDICEKEFQLKDGGGSLGGGMIKMNEKLERVPYEFGQDFCGGCCEFILSFLYKFKEDVKLSNTLGVAKPANQGITDSSVK